MEAPNYQESDVKLNKDQKTFYIDLQSGKKAIVNYENIDLNTIEVWHTEVPDENRGQGIAGILASKSISELAKTNPDKKIILSCTYLQAYHKKNPEKFKSFDNIH